MKMSCHMVEKDTIDAIVQKAVEQRVALEGADAFSSPRAFGQKLVNANIIALVERYGVDEANKMLPDWVKDSNGVYRWPGAGTCWPVIVDGSATKTDGECWRALKELDCQISGCWEHKCAKTHGLLVQMMLEMGDEAVWGDE